MSVRLISDEKIAETSSNGNQEKWFDIETNRWYKLDQFGYEALAETLISILLQHSTIEKDTPFTFVRYEMERLHVHKRDRTGCSSENFLKDGWSIITVNKLLNQNLGGTLRERLTGLPSDRKRIAYLAEATAEYTALSAFPQYLTLLFEIDTLFLNDDRHLNNIAVLEKDGRYAYCPIFDQGAGLLSNIQISPMDIVPKALIGSARARPFDTTFTHQKNTAESLYGTILSIPKFTKDELMEYLSPLLRFYPERDRSLIADRVVSCILIQQKKFM